MVEVPISATLSLKAARLALGAEPPAEPTYVQPAAGTAGRAPTGSAGEPIPRRWRIYYADGSTFDDSAGAPADAPTTGVIVIVQRAESLHWPRVICCAHDWYWWRPDEGRWYGGDVHGFLDQAAHCGAVWAKQGRMVTHDAYNAIMQRASHDHEFPQAGTP